MTPLDDAEKSLKIAAAILPGFASVGLALLISDIGEINDLQLILLALGLTYVNVALAAGISHVLRFLFSKRLDRSARKSPSYILLIIMSALTGVAVAWVYESEIVNNLVRTAFGSRTFLKNSNDSPLSAILKTYRDDPATRNEGRPNMFRPTVPANSKGATIWIRVRQGKDDPVIEGLSYTWSGRGQTDQIWLSPACIIENGQAHLVMGPGVIVQMSKANQVIMLDYEASPCACQYKLAFDIIRDRGRSALLATSDAILPGSCDWHPSAMPSPNSH